MNKKIGITFAYYEKNVSIWTKEKKKNNKSKARRAWDHLTPSIIYMPLFMCVCLCNLISKSYWYSIGYGPTMQVKCLGIRLLWGCGVDLEGLALWSVVDVRGCISLFNVYCILQCSWVSYGGWKSLQQLWFMDPRVLQYTYDSGWLLFKSLFACLCIDYIWMLYFNVYILSLVFVSLKLYMYCLVLQQNLFIGGF